MRIKNLLAIVLLLVSKTASAAPMSLGVNTHFEQGWPISDFLRVSDSGARAIRDTVTWGKVEQQPGQFRFTPKNSGFIDIACRRSIPVLLTIAPRNPLYDGGMAVFSPGGQRALARYIGALVDRFPCVMGVEVGNEFNFARKNWPDPAHRPAMYVSMLRAVRQELDLGHRHVALVGGATLGVAVDFHEQLFASGELSIVDAVSIHPYTNNTDVIPGQLARLVAAMRRHGVPKPIWATEFGNYYKTPDAAPPHALKIMTLMSAAGVQWAFWYALRDEPWYPNMGLYAPTGPKPALDTYKLAQRLIRSGNAHRIPSTNPNLFIYQFGGGPYVIWGNGQLRRWPPGARALDAQGHAIPMPRAFNENPVVIVTQGALQTD